MYCTNCGRKLPEDGSPCICGAQNGISTRSRRSIFRRRRSITAAARAPGHAGTRDVKTVCVVKAVFHVRAAFTVQMVVSAVSSVIEVFTVLQNQAYLLERTPVGTNFNVELNVNIVPVQNILVLIGLWLLYASAKKTDTPFMSTAGVTLFKVTEILQIVGCGIFCGMLLLIGFLVLLASSGAPNVTNYTGLPDNIAILIVGIAFVVGLVLSVLLLLYSIKMLGVWTSLQRAIQVGVLPKKLPDTRSLCRGFRFSVMSPR